MTFFMRTIRNKIKAAYNYCVDGVWQDTKKSPLVNLVKILNLSIGLFLNKSLQKKAASLTYYTLLAIIPTLAMLFAIGRGFGLQNLLQIELMKYFPAQKDALTKAFEFVENYLGQSSEGIFVGVGIIFLFATLYGLMNNVENTFNEIWGIRTGRRLYRKITDYTTVFFILPIFIICEGGLSVFIKTVAFNTIFSPIASAFIKSLPLLLAWIFFTGAFVIIPNTTVKLKNAIASGLICSISFIVLQWLFITGQLYVSKYNAIYGSFAFLPLLMVWMQLTWTITLGGVVISYSSQNIFAFNFQNHISDISYRYRHTLTILVLSIIVKQFKNGGKPYSENELSEKYDIPIKLVNMITRQLVDVGLICYLDENEKGIKCLAPTMDVDKYSVSYVNGCLSSYGMNGFLKNFDSKFAVPISNLNELYEHAQQIGNDSYLKDFDIKLK